MATRTVPRRARHSVGGVLGGAMRRPAARASGPGVANKEGKERENRLTTTGLLGKGSARRVTKPARKSIAGGERRAAKTFGRTSGRASLSGPPEPLQQRDPNTSGSSRLAAAAGAADRAAAGVSNAGEAAQPTAVVGSTKPKPSAAAAAAAIVAMSGSSPVRSALGVRSAHEAARAELRGKLEAAQTEVETLREKVKSMEAAQETQSGAAAELKALRDAHEALLLKSAQQKQQLEEELATMQHTLTQQLDSERSRVDELELKLADATAAAEAAQREASAAKAAATEKPAALFMTDEAQRALSVRIAAAQVELARRRSEIQARSFALKAQLEAVRAAQALGEEGSTAEHASPMAERAGGVADAAAAAVAAQGDLQQLLADTPEKEEAEASPPRASISGAAVAASTAAADVADIDIDIVVDESVEGSSALRDAANRASSPAANAAVGSPAPVDNDGGGGGASEACGEGGSEQSSESGEWVAGSSFDFDKTIASLDAKGDRHSNGSAHSRSSRRSTILLGVVEVGDAALAGEAADEGAEDTAAAAVEHDS